MGAVEINSSSTVCRRCGRAYGRLEGYFPVSYGSLYKGAGYLPYCKECVDDIFNKYLAVCHDVRAAARQVCRKLDIYWNEDLFSQTEKSTASRSVMTGYLMRLNVAKYSNKSYDDTLEELGVLWLPPERYGATAVASSSSEDGVDGSTRIDVGMDIEITKDIVEYWGPGYTVDMLRELEQRRRYWLSRLPEGVGEDVGAQAILRQICATEIDINRQRANGEPTDKLTRALNDLLGSASLKPTQKKDDAAASNDNTPFGVWIRRWENQRPIPEPDPDLQDVDGIARYISIWFYGHLCKMLNIKNTYSKLYEDEMAKRRVAHPELEDEDDEALFNDIFGGDGN